MIAELKYYHIIQVRRYTKHLFTDYQITENNTPTSPENTFAIHPISFAQGNMHYH